jgi:cytochrome c-type biogenesis protein CcmH
VHSASPKVKNGAKTVLLQQVAQANPETDAISQADAGTREISAGPSRRSLRASRRSASSGLPAQIEASTCNAQRAHKNKPSPFSWGTPQSTQISGPFAGFFAHRHTGLRVPEVEAITVSLLQADPDNTAAQ